MATRVLSIAPTQSTDTDFRAWINEIHNALIAFGWVRTSDTGQLDYATIAKPTGGMAGYAMYRMNDSLQSACPVYMRLDYGGGTQLNEPTPKVQVAIGGTDGAGTLTGNKTAAFVMDNNFGGAVTLRNMRSAGTSSSFRWSWRAEETGRHLTIAVERDLDVNGNETSNGVTLLNQYRGGGTSFTNSIFLHNGTLTSIGDTKWCGLISGQASQAGGGNTGVGPVRPAYGPFRYPMKTMLIAARGDFTHESTASISIYGSSHTYMFIQPASNIALNGINSACGFFMLWE
jgi:hypothetical protein